MEKICVGIDVDKATFKTCIVLSSEGRKILGSRTFSNSPKGFAQFTQWAGGKLKGRPSSYVMEATGVYHEYLAYYLHGQGERVHIVLPLKAKRYIQSLGIRSKTDKIDARGLAMMGVERELEVWVPASKHLLELRSLTRQVEAIQCHSTALKNQLEAATHAAVMHKSVVSSLKRMIAQAGREIDKLEKQIANLIEEDPVLKEKYAVLSSIKGVGRTTFSTVAAETNGFALFKNQSQLVCYAGYDVVENQSGKRKGKTRISKRGNAHIRRALHMAAWSAVRHDVAPFSHLHHRVYGRTDIKMKGYVAVQRKLLVMMYTLWKKNERFDPDFGNGGQGVEDRAGMEKDGQGHQKTAPQKEGTARDGINSDTRAEALLVDEQI